MMQIFILNLERRRDRKIKQTKSLKENSIGSDKYEFIKAHDGKAYLDDNTSNETALARLYAVRKQDGIIINHRPENNVQSAAWFWTWAATLKRILAEAQDDNEHWLLLIDDFCLTKPYDFYLNAISECENASSNGRVDILVLWCGYKCEWVYKAFGMSDIVGRDTPFDRDLIAADSEFVFGIRAPGDQATIVNRVGAKRLLDMMLTKSMDPERHIWMLAGEPNQKGLFSVASLRSCIGYLGEGTHGRDLHPSR